MMEGQGQRIEATTASGRTAVFQGTVASGQFVVWLASCGNPDYRQDPDRPLWGVVDGFVVVPSVEAAQQAVRRYIDENELGGGNWFGGHVFDHEGALVGKCSYNGRYWSVGSEYGPEAPQHTTGVSSGGPRMR